MRISDWSSDVCSSDLFLDAIAATAPTVEDGALALFGIAPARPETGYGYIAAGDLLADRTGVRTVRRFVEKPGREKAAAMLAEGGHYWNAGIFLMRADRFLDELQRQQPAMAQARSEEHTSELQSLMRIS